MKWLQKILLWCGAFLGVAVLLAITAALFLFALSSPVELRSADASDTPHEMLSAGRAAPGAR
ncbi:hypothetical protein [Pollutimonas bauzanensis]|uniref:Uncharacterized protein n=1 Tax=Pollutimonas bauzanensis TaxID=658167 RepID=A0A1M5X5C1_9BURK|nr:hypothetical protein [Pollutimonas bauzanensis]SHH95029.1 hypothetical protein SAMN04488135_106160 [Pollutimonas bauzanensis]